MTPRQHFYEVSQDSFLLARQRVTMPYSDSGLFLSVLHMLN